MNKNFSYRAQGVLLHEGRVLLQVRVGEEEIYALPGGQLEHGESAAEALAREFQEETGAAVEVGEFAWAEENFFSHKGQDYQQIALAFHVRPIDELPREDFPGREPHLRFYWMPIERLSEITVYPPNLGALLHGDVKHMVRREWDT